MNLNYIPVQQLKLLLSISCWVFGLYYTQKREEHLQWWFKREKGERMKTKKGRVEKRKCVARKYRSVAENCREADRPWF